MKTDEELRSEDERLSREGTEPAWGGMSAWYRRNFYDLGCADTRALLAPFVKGLRAEARRCDVRGCEGLATWQQANGDWSGEGRRYRCDACIDAARVELPPVGGNRGPWKGCPNAATQRTIASLYTEFFGAKT